MDPASASEYTATVWMPRRLAVRMTRHAISPRLAMRILSNSGLARAGEGLGLVAGVVVPVAIAVARVRRDALGRVLGSALGSRPPTAAKVRSALAKRRLGRAGRARVNGLLSRANPRAHPLPTHAPFLPAPAHSTPKPMVPVCVCRCPPGPSRAPATKCSVQRNERVPWWEEQGGVGGVSDFDRV
jgi:hypothetical protein